MGCAEVDCGSDVTANFHHRRIMRFARHRAPAADTARNWLNRIIRRDGQRPSLPDYSAMRATLSFAPFASSSPFLMVTYSTLFFASSARLFGCVGTDHVPICW